MTLTRTRLATLVACLLALATAAIVAGCGGSSSSSSEDPQKVLDETFNNGTKVTSGNLNVSVSVDAQGSQSGNFTASLDGPFQTSSDSTQFPQLDLTAKVSGGSQGQSISFNGGLIATKDAAFVQYNGQSYEVPAQTFSQFQQAYQQQAQAGQSSQAKSNASSLFKQLGIDPSTWLTNVTNEGTTDVSGTQTIHISGDADIEQIVKDFQAAAQQIPNAQAQSISPAQLDQVKNAVKSAKIDVYSGESDHILRKLSVSLELAPPSGSITNLKLDFSVTLSDVNQPQTITAPPNSKPLSDLLQQLGGLGALGGLSGGIPGVSSGGSSGVPTAPATGANSSQAAYLKCIQEAQGDSAKLNACFSKLNK